MDEILTPDEFDKLIDTIIYDSRSSAKRTTQEIRDAYRKLYNETIGSEEDEIKE